VKLTRQGVLDLDAEAPSRQRVVRRLVECSGCEGAGRVLRRDEDAYVYRDAGKCLECGGRGKIWVSQREQRR
jgi:DnaJ-class molecular chaperone